MKRQFDKFLATVPDEPQIHGYTAQRRAETNNLLDMIRIADALHRQEGGVVSSLFFIKGASLCLVSFCRRTVVGIPRRDE